MKSYKKLILTSLASAAILSAHSVEVQAAEIDFVEAETAVITEEVLDTLTVFEEVIPEATVETFATTTTQEEVSVTEETKAQNALNEVNPTLTEDYVTQNDGPVYDETETLVGITIGGETAPVTQEKPETVPAPVNNQPNRITSAISDTPATSVRFQWHTTDADTDARLYVWEEGQSEANAVEYTPELKTIDDAFHLQETPEGNYVYAILEGFDSKDKKPFRAVDGSDEPIGYFTDDVFTEDNIHWLDKGFDNWSIPLPYQAFEETAYLVEASGLTPATSYNYRMGNYATGLISEVGKFTTASTDKAPFTFIHYTDTQAAVSSDNVRPEWAYTISTLDSALETAPDATFALHNGDVVNDEWNDTEWVKTLGGFENLTKEMPTIYVSGNHDSAGFLDHINTPQHLEGMTEGTTYSLDYNGVHFVVLNTENDSDSPLDGNQPAILPDQMNWLRDDLAKASADRESGLIDWIIVTSHRPLFSASYHSLEDESVQLMRDDLMAVLDEYDVDLVLNGHDHNSTITKPLLHDGTVFGNARVDDTNIVTENGVTTFDKPEGTVFIVPNTAGTKTYEAIYQNKSVDWIFENEDIHTTYMDLFGYEVTPDDIDYFSTLFLMQEQPFRSAFYSDGHSNARESNIQNYGVVEVNSDTITYKLYEVVGEDLEAEGGRETNLVHTFVISKKVTVEELEERVNDLQTRLDSLEGQNELLEEEVASLKADLGTANANALTLQARLAELEALVNGLENEEQASETKQDDQVEIVEANDVDYVSVERDNNEDQDEVTKTDKVDAEAETEEAQVAKQAVLPQTGEAGSLLGLGLSTILAGLGLALPSKRRK